MIVESRNENTLWSKRFGACQGMHDASPKAHGERNSHFCLCLCDLLSLNLSLRRFYFHHGLLAADIFRYSFSNRFLLFSVLELDLYRT